MLLRPYLPVLLSVAVLAVSGDSQPSGSDVKQNQNKEDDLVAASSVNRQETKYLPEEKPEDHNAKEDVDSSEDVATDASTNYNTMVDVPGQERSMQYKIVRQNPKTYSKIQRQVVGSNYKPYKNTKYADTQRSPSLETIVPDVHPSVMRSLLKQEPQTFTDSQQRQAQDAPNWQVSSNTDSGFRTVKTGYSLPRGPAENQDIYNIIKRPIHVPNRVSVQNPSSDSSFNVGYSIGFGNTQSKPITSEYLKNPSNLRQGKTMSIPISYQNTPVNIHFDDKNTFWKNMGAGVEMSQSIDLKPRPFQYYGSNHNSFPSVSPGKQRPSHHNHQDHGPDDVSIPGRFSFDHNHALQQSNTFDFSNAIDPDTNKPYSEEKLNTLINEPQLSFGEPFSKPGFPSFADTVATPYYESSPRQSRPSHVELSKGNPSHKGSSHHSHSDRPNKFSMYKSEVLRYEQPSFSANTLRGANSVVYHPSPKGKDFSKNFPSNTRSVAPASYPLKATSTTNTHQVIPLNGENNLGFPGFPIAPQMFTPAGKLPPPGMIQAILVPVNAPGTSSFPYPMGMPIVGEGYSPYLGHPIGMVRIPEPAEPAYHGGSESVSSEMIASSATQPEGFSSNENSPVNQVHSHYTIVKHTTNEQPSEPSQYIQKIVYPPRIEGSHQTLKVTRVVPPESPGFFSTPQMFSPSSHLQQPFSVKNHPPRVQGSSMIIVKRL